MPKSGIYGRKIIKHFRGDKIIALETLFMGAKYTPVFPAYASLLNAHKKYPAHFADGQEQRPLDAHGAILSSMEFFSLLTQTAEYPYGIADSAIITSNLDYFSEILAGACIVELGIGSGLKTAGMLKQLTGKAPTAFYANDLVPENVRDAVAVLKDIVREITIPTDHSARQIGLPLLPKKAVHGVPGNFLGFGTWQAPARKSGGKQGASILDHIKNKYENTVVLLQGATINDYTQEDIERLFHFFHDQFSDNALFVISADSTTNRDALRRAYDNNAMRRLMIAGVFSLFWNALIDFMPLSASYNIAIRDAAEGCVDIALSVSFMGADYVFDRPIRKIPFALFEMMARNAGLEVVRRLPFKDERFSDFDHAIIVLKKQSQKLSVSRTPPAPGG